MSVAAIVWLFLAIVWGTTWLAVSVGLETLPPILFAGIRFLIAASVLWAISLARRTRLPRDWRTWRLILGTGFLAFAVTYSLQFWGQQHVASGLAAVMFATVPLCTLLLAHYLLPSEPMTLRKLSGVVLGLCGVALVFVDQLSVEGVLAVVACVGFLVASLSMAWAQVLVKQHGSRLDPTTLAAAQMTVGGVVLTALGWRMEGSPFELAWTLPAVTAMAYLSLVGSATAFLLFYWLLKRMQVTRVTAMMLVHPVVAVVLGAVFLNESLGWEALVGGLLILVSVGLVLRGGSSTSRARGPATHTTGSHPVQLIEA